MNRHASDGFGSQGFESDGAALRKAHVLLIKSLQRLRGVKRFHYFLAHGHLGETAAEKYIMGRDYVPWLDGKLAYCCRNQIMPHRESSSQCPDHAFNQGGFSGSELGLIIAHEVDYEEDTEATSS